MYHESRFQSYERFEVKFVIIESKTIEQSQHFGTGQLTDLYLQNIFTENL